MNIKIPKPYLEGRETAEKIDALITYVENIKTETDFNLSLISKRLDRLGETIEKMKGESS